MTKEEQENYLKLYEMHQIKLPLSPIGKLFEEFVKTLPFVPCQGETLRGKRKHE